jgi:uncharacterized protein YjaG (DUF416 family)
MTPNEISNIFDQSLSKLATTHALLFSSSCCDRAVPNAVAYAHATNHIDAAVLTHTMEEVWQFLSKVRPMLDAVVLKEACREQYPPNEDPLPLAGAAADAVQMIDLLMSQVLDGRVYHCGEIAEWAHATIEAYLLATTDQVVGPDHIVQSGLMQAELTKQAASLRWLTDHPHLDSESIARFRGLFRDPGASNLGIRIATTRSPSPE